jgi:RNAse (barnase) inhibitor barstar
MPDELTIDGVAVHDIPSFYDEINRVFMSGESWRLGESLDALDDLLYGGYGALHGRSSARVVWTDHEASRRALGREATIAHHRSKLERPGVFDSGLARSAISALEAGEGTTYFEIALAIFADHPSIELVLA